MKHPCVKPDNQHIKIDPPEKKFIIDTCHARNRKKIYKASPWSGKSKNEIWFIVLGPSRFSPKKCAIVVVIFGSVSKCNGSGKSRSGSIEFIHTIRAWAEERDVKILINLFIIVLRMLIQWETATQERCRLSKRRLSSIYFHLTKQQIVKNFTLEGI